LVPRSVRLAGAVAESALHAGRRGIALLGLVTGNHDGADFLCLAELFLARVSRPAKSACIGRFGSMPGHTSRILSTVCRTSRFNGGKLDARIFRQALEACGVDELRIFRVRQHWRSTVFKVPAPPRLHR